MKLSLQRRIQLSFFLSVALVVVIGIISFSYIHRLNDEVQQIIEQDITLSHSGEKIKTAFFSNAKGDR
jgi:CHASE3 domain sensor protein